MLLILLALLVYSALVIWSASGQDIGMMERKIGQIAMGLIIMVVMAQIPPRVYEGWAPYLYIFCIILLVAVDAFGAISKGAQRWLDLGVVRFQPSEIAKIAVPLMVARFINRDVCPPSLKNTAIALVLIFLPTLLVAAQPDLGTSILIALSGLFVLFLSGLSWRLIGIAVVLIAAFIPILWFFLMHDYQRQRVMMLLDPETDPLGAGYHIIQSKIAIGSGGLRGKGWLHGTQSQLEFLPERHTDFIFAVLAEELGLVGILILLALYVLLIMRGLWIAARAQTTFGRVMAGGLMLILFVYVFVNIGMVSGILPVVGVPLPLGIGMRKQWLGICIAASLLAACTSDDGQQQATVAPPQPALTAAHPTLPIPSYARITNLANGRMIVVRINDRGPYGNDRVISLSRASADRLNTSNNTKVRIDPIIVAQDGSLSGPGTACTTVAKQTYALPDRPNLDGGMGSVSSPAEPAQPGGEIRPISNDTLQSEDSTGAPVKSSGFLGAPTTLASGVLEGSEPTPAPAPVAAPATQPAPVTAPAATQSAAAAPAAASGSYMVQVGAVSDQARAKQYQQRLSQQFGVPGRVEQNGAVWRIQMGPFASKSQAASLQQRLQNEAQLQSFIAVAK
ncbi:hypothetical protein L1887_52559 [Cichorium endivia]|nr:hypothetical protein L1887_52559 [Cichorium endivia]